MKNLVPYYTTKQMLAIFSCRNQEIIVWHFLNLNNVAPQARSSNPRLRNAGVVWGVNCEYSG